MDHTQSEKEIDVHDQVYGYSIASEFLGQKVRVYLVTGNTLSGVLTEARGKYIFVERESHGKLEECFVNLDHVTSVTKD